MQKVILHPGEHSPELIDLVARAWEEEECLVLCPSRVRDPIALCSLPSSEVEWRGDWTARPALPARKALTFPEKPLFGVFTTGTSREPRLVYYSRRNIEASLSSIFSLFDVSRIETIFCYPQASHTFGLVLGYLAAKRFGWRLAAAPGKYTSAAHAARLELKEPGLVTLGTPAHFRDLLSYCLTQNVRPAPSYSAIVGGGPVTRELWRMMRDELKIEAPSIGYGATEASPGVSHLPPGVEPRADGEIGFPLPHLQIALSEEGVGFRGDSLALAIASGEQVEFPRMGFLADKIVAGPDGRWQFAGRRDALLNRGGEKFALETLEAALGPLLGRELVAAPIRDARLGQELGVLVGAKRLETHWLDQAGEVLRAATGCRFAGVRFRAVESLPLNGSGKPDRAAASRLLEERAFPVPSAELGELVPHRPPMVWIDEVIDASAEGGLARVRYRADALFSSTNGPRRSAFAEFLAQGYGFVQACARRGATKPKDAFLAALSKIELAEDTRVAEGEWLLIEVRRVREMGPLALVEGQVRGESGRVLARGQLKLFAQ